MNVTSGSARKARFATVMLASLLSLAGPGNALAARQTVRAALSIVLEDSILAEGQTIYMLIRLKNEGDQPLADLAPLAGYLSLRLFRADSLREILPAPWGSAVEPTAGETLGIGAEKVVVRNLAIHFSTPPTDINGIAPRLGEPSLEPGRYRLEARYTAHPSRRKEHGLATLDIAPVMFEVRPLRDFPEEAARVKTFLDGLPHLGIGIERSPLSPYASSRLQEFLGSRFLLLIYLSQGALLDSTDFDKLFAGVVSAGAPATRRAALLGLRLSMTDRKGEFTEEWRRRMRGIVTSEIERSALSMVPPREE